MLAAELDLSSARRRIVSFIKRQVEESQTDSAVLGISGGIDSAVMAYLCAEALFTSRNMVTEGSTSFPSPTSTRPRSGGSVKCSESTGASSPSKAAPGCGRSTSESEIGMSYETIDQAFKLRFEEMLEVPAIAGKIKQSKAKLDSIFAKYGASEHKRRMPEICKLR